MGFPNLLPKHILMEIIKESLEFVSIRFYVRQRSAKFVADCFVIRNDTNEIYAKEFLEATSYGLLVQDIGLLIDKYRSAKPMDWKQRRHAELLAEYQRHKDDADFVLNSILKRINDLVLIRELREYIDNTNKERVQMFKKVNFLSDEECQNLFKDREKYDDYLDRYYAIEDLYDMMIEPSDIVKKMYERYGRSRGQSS